MLTSSIELWVKSVSLPGSWFLFRDLTTKYIILNRVVTLLMHSDLLTCPLSWFLLYRGVVFTMGFKLCSLFMTGITFLKQPHSRILDVLRLYNPVTTHLIQRN